MPANSPILIGQSVSNILNGSTQFVPEGFKNPLKQGVWIDEIRFTVTSRKVAGGTWGGDVPDALRVAIRLGKAELTKGLIPAALLCRPRDWLGEAPSVLHNFIWRLPKPLYLPQNGNVSVQLQQREDFQSSALRLDVDVALVCRPTLEVPENVHVPYAAFFQGTMVTSGTTVEQSNENDLRNPFQQTLNIVRFALTNWATMPNTDDGIGAFAQNPTFGIVSQVPGWTFDAPGMCGANTIRLFDSDGDFGVRDVTPSGAFVALADRTWKVNAKLKPNNYFIVEMSTKLSTGYFKTRQAVGMIGYRTIPLAELGVAR